MFSSISLSPIFLLLIHNFELLIDLFDTFAKCEELLLKVVKQNSIVQNTAIRLIIDGLFEAVRIF